MRDQLIVFGAGGHAKVAVEVIEREGSYGIAFLADSDIRRLGDRVMGYLVRSEADGLADVGYAVIAIGDNAARRRVADAAKAAGLTLVTVIDPSAFVSRTATIGAGTVVMPGVVVNADAHVGANVILNTGVVVEHDCRIGDGAHIAPHSTLCGAVSVGAGAMIGAGSTLVPGTRVGAGTVIGAHSTVLRDIPDGVTAVGSPCRIVGKPA